MLSIIADSSTQTSALASNSLLQKYSTGKNLKELNYYQLTLDSIEMLREFLLVISEISCLFRYFHFWYKTVWRCYKQTSVWIWEGNPMQIKQKNTYFRLQYFNAFIFRGTRDLQKTSQFEIFLQKCLFFKLYYLIFLDSLLRIYEYFVLTACT